MKTNKSDTFIKTHIAEEAFTGRPPRKSNRSIPISLLGVRYRSIRNLAKSWDINDSTLRGRLRRKWDLLTAVVSPVNEVRVLIYEPLGRPVYFGNWSHNAARRPRGSTALSSRAYRSI